MEQIDRIDASGMTPALNECRFTLACDVSNPFFGPNGSAHVFAPQKGADPEMVERLDNGLRNFARVVMQFNGTNLNRLPGSGAAGGMGGGCAALLGARLERGIDMVLRAIRFHETIKGSSMVITGEGQIDRQTLMGKAPAGILAAAMQQQIPVIAIGGRVVSCPELAQSGFHAILCINEEGLPPQTAMRHEVAWENVRRCGIKVGKMLQKRMEQPV